MSGADERDLERYLGRDDPLSRAYAELKSERPSPALDQAVLARARDALQTASRPRVTRQRQWTALAAIAATVLLSFGLVMRLALEPEPQISAPAQESAPATAADDGSLAETDASPKFATPPSTATPAAPASIEDQRPAIESEIRATAEQAPAVPEPVPPAAVAPRRDYAPPAPAQAPMEAQGESAPATQPVLLERSSGITGERDEAQARKSQSSTVTSDAVTANSTDLSALAKEEVMLTPEAWLAEIARLRAAGETEAADRELERFKKAYPEYPQKLEPHSPPQQ